MVIGALSAVTAPADPRNNRELKNKQIKSNIYAAVMAVWDVHTFSDLPYVLQLSFHLIVT